jgi:hypothetical protein
MSPHLPQYWIGADFARKRDFTAVSIIEQIGTRAQITPENPLRVRHCERLPLGTRYTDIEGYLRELVEDTRRYAQARCEEIPRKLRGDSLGVVILVVDESRLGAPMFDLLEKAKLHPTGITIIGGPEWSSSGRHYRVPLNDLITVIELAMEQRVLAFAKDLEHLPALVDEFANFERRLTKAGNETYGNFREGTHDDMIFSIAIPLWVATCGYQGFSSMKLLGV